MSELEPLPDELADLFAAERSAPVASDATRAALRSKLTAAAAPVLVGKAAAAATVLGGTGKVLAVFALTVAAGAGTVAVIADRDEVARTERAPLQHHVEPPAAPREEPAPIGPQELAIEVPPPPVTPQPRRARTIAKAADATPAIVEPVDTRPSQAQLLKSAWSALASGSPAHALELAREDQENHPAGDLAEERDALVIQALAKLSRADEAREAAALFFARYPNSIHRTRIEQLVAREESP